MNIPTNNSDPTKKLIKWFFSWNFFGFVIYCISVIITVGIVSVGIFYFTDHFFHTNILSLVEGSHCGYYGGGIICTVEKLTIKALSSWIWIIIIIPIVITVFGSIKYDKKNE